MNPELSWKYTYRFPDDNDELLDECEVMTFRASGKGGQHVNKTDSAVRLKHNPTGLVVVCQRERSQFQNKQIAIEWLRNKITEAQKVEKTRIPSRVPPKEKRKRLVSKLVRSSVKQSRGRPDLGE